MRSMPISFHCTAKERVGSLNLCPPQERYPNPQTALVALTSTAVYRDLGLLDPVINLQLRVAMFLQVD
jgi:hypothetical protein